MEKRDRKVELYGRLVGLARELRIHGSAPDPPQEALVEMYRLGRELTTVLGEVDVIAPRPLRRHATNLAICARATDASFLSAVLAFLDAAHEDLEIKD